MKEEFSNCKSQQIFIKFSCILNRVKENRPYKCM